MLRFNGTEAFIHYEDAGEGRVALLLHGFASNHRLNWVSTSWIETLTGAGYRVIAPDLRGHGESEKFYDPEDYTPEKIAGDIDALMEDLALERVELMGYSMGARVAVALAARDQSRFRHIILAGVGETLMKPADDPEAIARALSGEGPDNVPPGGTYRAFAERHGGDLKALAACVRGVRTPLDPHSFAEIRRPVMVISGENDDVSGPPGPLADLNPRAEAVIIPGKDHMMAVGDAFYKRSVLEFIAEGA